MFFDRFADEVRDNDFIAQAIEAGQWDRAIDYVNQEVFDKPEEYYSLAKLRQAAAVDRRVTLREILEKVFDLIPRFKSRDELLEEEFAKFVADYKPDEAESIAAIRAFFKAYLTSGTDPRYHRESELCRAGNQFGLFLSRLSRGTGAVPQARSRVCQGLRVLEPIHRLERVHDVRAVKIQLSSLFDMVALVNLERLFPRFRSATYKITNSAFSHPRLTNLSKKIVNSTHFYRGSFTDI